MIRKHNVKNGNVLLLNEFKKWVDFNRHEWRYNTFLIARSCEKVFRTFQKKYRTKMRLPYDKEQYRKFYKYCMDVRKMQMSTFGRYSRILRAVIRFYDPRADYSFLKTGDYPPVIYSLSKKELKLWVNAPVKNGWRVKTRDLFALSAYTGMRFSDTQQQNLFECLEGKVLRYNSIKTGVESVVPVRPELKEILERHNFKFPITNQVFNRQLKMLAKELKLDRIVDGKPMYEQLSSHIGRKTFITNAIRDKIPVPYVMKMAGITEYNTIKRYLVVNEEDILNATDMWFNDE